MRFDQCHQRRQRRGAAANPVSKRGDAEVDALGGEALALAVQRLMLTELGITVASSSAPARPRAIGWNGAGGWVIV